MRNTDAVQASWKETSWEIKTKDGRHYEADMVLMDVYNHQRGVYEGTLVAVHGLPAEQASELRVGGLRELGVGSQTTNIHARPAGRYVGRAQLGSGGSVEYQQR